MYDEVKVIGIGLLGFLDVEKGVIIYILNFLFNNFNLVELLNKKFGVFVYLDNDVNVVVIGEYMFGVGRGIKYVVFFIVSIGVGGGVVLDGKIYRGYIFNVLEIGYMIVVLDGLRCNCGNIGCVEVILLGIVIVKRG